MSETINDVLSVSSGTMATLTGFKSFRAIDCMMDFWVEFEIDSPTETAATGLPSWQQSWDSFKASANYQTALVTIDRLDLEGATK